MFGACTIHVVGLAGPHAEVFAILPGENLQVLVSLRASAFDATVVDDHLWCFHCVE